jgi:uncharacterized membrane-anchored protein
MAEPGLRDHAQRYALANELHARPFPDLSAPSRAVFLAIKQENDAANRDREADVRHLLDLLDRFGAPHPAPDANHHFATLGRVKLKWERHTEFVTYTIFAQGVADVPFSGSAYGTFPRDWLARAPGAVLTSVLVRIEAFDTEAEIEAAMQGRAADWFVPESLASARVADGQAAILGDFRIDPAGHVRFAVLARRDIGPRRLGRIVQRLLEIETYKSIAMLTLPVARTVSARVAVLDAEMTGLIAAMAGGGGRAGSEAETLDRLLAMSAEIEALSSSSAFRFSAAEAYEALVNQRIDMLRESRVEGRQTFGEFMHRRFDPAMRTCRSARERLSELSQRASRAANLLRTRVEVAMSAQNRSLLRSMDRRAALQLRLQQTVEGLSVVAISYYAVSLAHYILEPVGRLVGVESIWLEAAVVVPVLIGVWLLVRRIRTRIERRFPQESVGDGP